MESYLNEHFALKEKNLSDEARQRWRKLCWVVKSKKRRFRFTANLDKRSEAQTIRRSNQITPLDCSLFLTGIGLEISSVVLDLLSSPEKPRYALGGMLCANVAVVLSFLELIYEGITKRELLASQNTAQSLIMMLPEITGFGLATIQSISSVVQFYYYSRHEHNHLNVYLAGVYVCFCLFLFKFGRKSSSAGPGSRRAVLV